MVALREADIPPGGVLGNGEGGKLGSHPCNPIIPDLMRAYMYTYGYRKPSIGQELIVSLGLPNHVCEDCDQCPVKCLNGWNVSHKIRDIVRLRDVPSEFIV